MPSILLVRHAQASFGAADYDELSGLGREQAEVVAAEIERRGVVPVRVVAGGLRRQRDTAAVIAARFDALEVTVDERLDEYDDRSIIATHGELPVSLERADGDPALEPAEFQRVLNGALASWLYAGSSSPASETHTAFASRVTGAISDLAASLRSGEVAVAVSSAGAIASACTSFLRLPPVALITLNHVAVNASITKLVSGRSGINVVSLGEHGHLESSAGRSLVTYR